MSILSNGTTKWGETQQNVGILYRAPQTGIRASDRRADPLLNLYQAAYRISHVKYADQNEVNEIWDEQRTIQRNPFSSDYPFEGSSRSSYVIKYLRIESVYLGKYYVGDVEVLRNSEELFDKHDTNKVERHLPYAGELHAYDSETSSGRATWLSNVKNVGCTIFPLIQGAPNHITMAENDEGNKWLLGTQYSTCLMRRFRGEYERYNPKMNLPRKTHRPVLPISMTYQGDEPQ